MKKKIELEYNLSSSPKVLFKRLSTEDGLAEWFADSVDSNGDIYTFSWEGEKQKARLLNITKDESISFQWVEDEGEDYFFKFTMEIDPMTNEVALIITDFVEDDDEDDTIELWDKQIEVLLKTLGLS